MSNYKRFETAEEFVEWYNRRIHGALDLDRRNTRRGFYQKVTPAMSLWTVLEKDGEVINMKSDFDWKRKRKNIRTLHFLGVGSVV
ncbi:MAG: hypothetical protein WBA22_12680 [Candidatus Methanofastidiosia archaeon]